MNRKEVIYLSDTAVEVIRTRRNKSMALRVKEGSVNVLVPNWIELYQVKEFVQSKESWISSKLANQLGLQEQNRKRFVNGELFSLKGASYPLCLLSGGQKPAQLINGSIQISIPESLRSADRVRNALERWYRQQAETWFVERTLHYSDLMGVKPSEIRVKAYRARWGSCSSRGVVSYNWKLIMAPEKVSEYVVVHELCHLIHPNHSRDFWNEVERYMPDYKHHKQWLNAHGASLDL